MNSILIADESVMERRSAPGYFWVGFWTMLGSIAAGALVLVVCWAWLGYLIYDSLKHLLR